MWVMRSNQRPKLGEQPTDALDALWGRDVVAVALLVVAAGFRALPDRLVCS